MESAVRFAAWYFSPRGRCGRGRALGLCLGTLITLSPAFALATPPSRSPLGAPPADLYADVPLNLSATQRRDAQEMYAICRPAKDLAPALNYAPGTEAKCNSEATYYGMPEDILYLSGRSGLIPHTPAPDPKKARECAVSEVVSGGGGDFSGNAMLVTLYANGAGVEKNLPLALHYACEAVQWQSFTGIRRSAPGPDQTARVDEPPFPVVPSNLVFAVDKLIKANWTGHDFDVCGFSEPSDSDECPKHLVQLLDLQRAEALDKTATSWGEQGKVDLTRIGTTYGDVLDDDQKYLSAMKSPERNIGNYLERAKGSYVSRMVTLQSRPQIGGAPAALAAPDADLNAAYRELMQRLKADRKSDEATMVRDGERMWIAFRDDFVKTVGGRYGAAVAQDLDAQLTRERALQLETLLDAAPRLGG